MAESEAESKTGIGSVTSTFISENANRMIESVADLKAILPERFQFKNLISAMNRIEGGLSHSGTHVAPFLAPIIERLHLLAQHLPDKGYYDRMEEMTLENNIVAFESMQNTQTLFADIPTKAQMEILLQQIESGQISNEDA